MERIIRILLMVFLLTLSIDIAVAEDVPFVFSKDYASIAGYSSDQIKDICTSNEDLNGIPSEALESYYPNLVSRVEPRNAIVRHESVLLAQKYPGNHTIGQICSIFSYLNTGDNTTKGWSYINDPRGSDYFEYANESLQMGREAGYSGTGDCDDFAILMSALIEAIGGTTRIVLASHDNGDSGHAFAEVYLGQDDSQDSNVEHIVSWLMDYYDTRKIYTHVNPDTKEVWLNLDWSANHPGGHFYKSDKYEFYYIHPELDKTSLNAEASSKRALNDTTISDDYVCMLTVDQVKDYLKAFFNLPGDDYIHLRLDDSRVLTYNSLVKALDGVKITEASRYSATERANQIAGLWRGAIFYLPRSNKVYVLVVSDNGGKTIELIKISSYDQGDFKFSSIGWMRKDNSKAIDELPADDHKITTNEIWQIDH